MSPSGNRFGQKPAPYLESRSSPVKPAKARLWPVTAASEAAGLQFRIHAAASAADRLGITLAPAPTINNLANRN